MSTIASGRPRALKRRKAPGSQDKLTVGQYLLKALSERAVSHLFLASHPDLLHLAKTVLAHPKVSLITNSSIESCSEMADGYGKAKGICAMAMPQKQSQALDILMRASHESVPLVLIFGTSQEKNSCSDEWTNLIEKLLRQFSVSWTELSDPRLAAKKIDRVLDSCLFFKKPVCIELPQEVVDRFIPPHTYRPTEFGVSDPDTLDEVLLMIESLLSKSKHPLLYVGRVAIAHNLVPILLHFAETWNIPITNSSLARTFLLEAHPNYAGKLTLSRIGRSDLLISIGSEQIPFEHKGPHITISDQHVSINRRTYPQLLMKEVLVALCSLEPEKRPKLWGGKERGEYFLEDVLISCRDARLLEEMSTHFTGDVITSHYASPHYSLAAAIGAVRAQPLKQTVVILDESDLRSSLTELYIAHEECLPLLVCVVGDGSWVKGLFPDVPVYRRKFPDSLPHELIVVSLI